MTKMSEIVQHILNAEKKAEQIVTKAESDKSKAISQAREKTVDSLNRRKKQIEKKIGKKIDEGMEDIAQQKKKISEKYSKDVRAFTREAEKNIDAGANFLLEKLKTGEGYQ
jgi:vacuolar-type H+-ATPase subunit H